LEKRCPNRHSLSVSSLVNAFSSGILYLIAFTIFPSYSCMKVNIGFTSLRENQFPKQLRPFLEVFL
jgi:hypothetical protein